MFDTSLRAVYRDLGIENYDRDLEDSFELQDEITIKIIDVMQIKLIYGEQARMWSDSTNNIQAYDMNMRGSDCFFRINKKDNKQAQYFFKKAISIDEKYAIPYAMLGFTRVLDLCAT